MTDPRSETEQRLRVARFVADHWRKAMVEWGKPGDAHPLCMVLAALDGATDPVECGIDDEAHDDFRAALSGRTAADYLQGGTDG